MLLRGSWLWFLNRVFCLELIEIFYNLPRRLSSAKKKSPVKKLDKILHNVIN